MGRVVALSGCFVPLSNGAGRWVTHFPFKGIYSHTHGSDEGANKKAPEASEASNST